MSTPKFSSFVKQHGQLWCKGKNFNIYLAPENMANNNTVNTVYVEHDPSITLEEVKAMVIADHTEMYNNMPLIREDITLNDIINGLNKLNFVSI